MTAPCHVVTVKDPDGIKPDGFVGAEGFLVGKLSIYVSAHDTCIYFFADNKTARMFVDVIKCSGLLDEKYLEHLSTLRIDL